MREGRELRREDGLRRGQLERNPCKTNEGAPDENPAPRPFPHAPLDQRGRPRKGCGGCAPPQSIVTGSVFVVMMVIVMATMKEVVLVTLACDGGDGDGGGDGDVDGDGGGDAEGGDGYGDDVMVVVVKRVRNNAYAASGGYLWFRVNSAEPSLSVLVPFVSVSSASRPCNTTNLF